jgi:hypothetical protein
VPATLDERKSLDRYWPIGIVDIFTERDGLVFQRGDQELCGIKFQHVDRRQRVAHFVHIMDSALIAAALPYSSNNSIAESWGE